MIFHISVVGYSFPSNPISHRALTETPQYRETTLAALAPSGLPPFDVQPECENLGDGSAAVLE